MVKVVGVHTLGCRASCRCLYTGRGLVADTHVVVGPRARASCGHNGSCEGPDCQRALLWLPQVCA